MHSIVWQYLDAPTRTGCARCWRTAAPRATAAAPLAWLRMEPPPPGSPERELAELRLTLWPGADERVLGHAGYHGVPVRLDTLPA